MTCASVENNPFAIPQSISVGGSGVTCLGLRIDGPADAWCARLQNWVTVSEWERAQRFAQDIDAARHLVGRALVRTVLARTLSLAVMLEEFSLSPWGKPVFSGSDIDFSISHSGNMIWVAFCRETSVGIDVESSEGTLDIGRLSTYLHPQERAYIMSLPEQEAVKAFYRCWVRKEALVKASGQGLTLPLTAFQVQPADMASDWFPSDNNVLGGSWTTRDLVVPKGYFCSVAAKGAQLPIVAVMCSDVS